MHRYGSRLLRLDTRSPSSRSCIRFVDRQCGRTSREAARACDRCSTTAIQKSRYGLCGPNRELHTPKQRCLFLRRKGRTWLWAVVPNLRARKPRDGASPRDLAPASRRRATAMPDPTAAPFAARCNPGRVRWLVGLRKTSSAELQNAEFPAGRNHRLQTGNR